MLQEERALLLETWLEFEQSLGEEGAEQAAELQKKLPRKLKKQREVFDETGVSTFMHSWLPPTFPYSGAVHPPITGCQ